jgi:hypothetical protein
MILFGEDALRKSIREFLDHFHEERNHQGLGNRLIIPINATVDSEGRDRTPEKTRRFDELLMQGGIRIGLLLLTAAFGDARLMAIAGPDWPDFVVRCFRLRSRSRSPQS